MNIKLKWNSFIALHMFVLGLPFDLRTFAKDNCTFFCHVLPWGKSRWVEIIVDNKHVRFRWCIFYGLNSLERFSFDLWIRVSMSFPNLFHPQIFWKKKKVCFVYLLKWVGHRNLRYQVTPNDNTALSPFERQVFHKNPGKLRIFWTLSNWSIQKRI